MLTSAEKLINKYIAYCMTHAFEARKAGDPARAGAYQKLAGNLVNCCLNNTDISTLRDNLAGRDDLTGEWPRAQEYGDACAGLLRQVEIDMCYDYHQELYQRWQKSKRGAEWYALRDILECLEQSGFVAAIEAINALATGLETERAGGVDALADAWIEEKLAVYREALAEIEARSFIEMYRGATECNATKGRATNAE